MSPPWPTSTSTSTTTAAVPKKKSCLVVAEKNKDAPAPPSATTTTECSASSSERHAHFNDGDAETESSRTNNAEQQPESGDDEQRGEESPADVESDEDDSDDDDEDEHHGAQAFRRRREASVRSSSRTAASLTHKLAAATVGVAPVSSSSLLVSSSSHRRQSHPQPQSSVPLVHRWDEYGDFVSRSERSRRGRQAAADDAADVADWENDRPSGVSRSSTTTAGVQFGGVLEQELPPLHPDDHSKCYMTPESWERIDLDVELTKKRWDNHTAGLLPFDHGTNTTRGLECVLCETRGRHRDVMLVQHATSVLQEQNRQRVLGEFYNAELMRHVASQTSLQDEARQQGQHDAEDARNAWLEQPPSVGGACPAFVPAAHHPKKGKPTKPTGGKKHGHGKGGGLMGLLGLHSKPKKKSASSKS